VPRTDKDGIAAGRDVLIESGDELLMEFAEAGESDKVVKTYVPALEGKPVLTLKPNNPLETGRVSYSGTEQTFPRQVGARLAEALREVRKRNAELNDKRHVPYGVRDCLVPSRPGWVFYSVDYEGGELVTHGQSCKNLVGFSVMGDALAAGANVHGALGATMMGLDYAEFMHRLKVLKDKRVADFRQAAKPGNFGFPGGMGAAKLVEQQRKPGGSIPDTPHPNGPSLVWDTESQAWVPGYRGVLFCVLVGATDRCGVEKTTEWKGRETPPLCIACIKVAEHIRETWFRQWPENKPYFDYVSRIVDDVGEVVQHYSGRIRGGVDFTSAANGYFQAFLADITGRAQCRVWHEQYVDRRSVLYGTRSILFAHDELFGETPEDIAADAANRVAEIMVEEFREACPDFAAACKAEPALARRWYKSMSPVFVDGKLVPWEPKA
jgi:DNA polymerase-1